MPATVFPSGALEVVVLNRAFNDQSATYNVFNNQVTRALEVGFVEFARLFGASFGGLSEDALSTKLLGNLGVLPNAGLQAALKEYLVQVGKENVGIVALQLGAILSTLENATGEQAVYKAGAAAWNSEVETSYAYSSNPANTSPGPVTGGPDPAAGVTLALTPGADMLSPTASEAKFRTTANNDTIVATTVGVLNSADVLDGAAGVDTLRATLAAGTSVAPTLTNIEKVFIQAGGAVTFDASHAAGVRELWSNAAQGPAKFLGVDLGTQVGIQNSETGAVLTVEFAGVGGAADAANIVLADATGGDEIIVGGVETLNVRSAAGSTALTTVNQARITADAAEAIVITGDQGLTTAVQGALVARIDALALGKSLNLTVGAASAATVVVLGGVGADTFSMADASNARLVLNAGDGADTIHLNARASHSVTTGTGADVVNVTFAAALNKALNLSDGASLASSAIVVTDFTSGTDVLNLQGTGSGKVALTAAQLANVAASSSLLTAAELAASTVAAKGSIMFRYGADTYVLVNDGVAGNALDAADSLIKLTGVAVLADASWTAA